MSYLSFPFGVRPKHVQGSIDRAADRSMQRPELAEQWRAAANILEDTVTLLRRVEPASLMDERNEEEC
jgi:hypothetical protein